MVFAPNGRRVQMSTAMSNKVDSIEVGSTGLNRWWRVVGGLLMNIALGTLYAWSVFVAPLEKEFGWKRADTSMVFTIAIFMTGFTFLLSGWIYDKWGPSFSAFTGGILASLGFYFSAYTHSLSYLYMCFGVLGGFGAGLGCA